MIYDPKSSKAEEFINHEEILESLEYAKANKDNKELIKEILDKANKAKGLTHREAALLLECEDKELIEKIKSQGIDPCGENGEYHTFVVDGPIFDYKIDIKYDKSKIENNCALSIM